MKSLWACGGILLISSAAMGQSTDPAPTPSVACSKTITFAAAAGGQPVPAIPKFAAKWIGKAKHVEGYPDMCLSQVPSSKTANYVVVFSTSESNFDGLMPIAHTYVSTGPVSGDAAGISSYGGTWDYTYKGVAPPETTSTIELQRIDASKKVLFLRAYNQQGHIVSHYSVDGDHNRELRLEQVMAEIHRDTAEKPSVKRIAAPLSVYYVNCDVDSPGPTSLVASAGPSPAAPPDATPAPASPPPPPPHGTLELVSTPSAADIYLDDKYIGKTPFIVTVAPGEHVIIIRKQDFGTWGRKLQVAPGPRRVTAYLEQKFLTLPLSPPQAAQQPGMQPQAAAERSARPATTKPQASPSQASVANNQ